MVRTEAEVREALCALGLSETDPRYYDALTICRVQSPAAALLWIRLIEVMEMPHQAPGRE